MRKMSEHVWQFGDWGRTYNGTVVRFVSVWDGGEIFVGATGVVNCLRDVEYLPDCTGYDWKPIEPPEGYRILGRKEEVVPGDKYKANCHDKWFDATVFGDTVERLKAASTVAYARKIEPIEPPEGYRLLERGEKVRNWDMALKRDGTWIELLSDDVAVDSEQLPGYTYARKIEPKYRPFASAVEYAPHRERWLRRKQNGPHSISVTEYSDLGIWLCGNITCVTYEKAFKEFEFEHGEPFGVEIK